MEEFLYKQESYAILGAIFEVHKKLGCGFLEKVYQEALEIEFKLRKIPYEREKNIKISYKGVVLKQEYCADFVCFDKIIIELKAVDIVTEVHEAQLHNYLYATGYKVGYLINFGEEYIHPKRICFSYKFSKNSI